MAVQRAVTSWTLSVTILRGENIASFDWGSESDCYVTVALPSKSTKVYRTKTVANSKNPEWNETFTFKIYDNIKGDLEVKLYDEDTLKYDDHISSQKLDVSSLTVGKKQTQEVIIDPEGKLCMAFELLERERKDSSPLSNAQSDVTRWTLNVTILRGENIPSFDWGSESDCYVTVALPSKSTKVYRTKTVANSKNPEWNETFTFNINDNLKGDLEVTMYDEDTLKYDDHISSMKLDVSSLTVGKKETKEDIIKPESKLWMECELLERERKVFSSLSNAKEKISYLSLNITVLRAEQLPSKYCIMSSSDRYVTLSLPTATAKTYRTKTVSSNNNPEWNETFTFRVPTHVKNILELELCHEGFYRPGGYGKYQFDVPNLPNGMKETEALPIRPETEEKLLIAFELLQSEDPPCEYLTNGVLLAAPLSVLDINIDKLQSGLCYKVLTLRGAYDENRTLNVKETPKLRFYVNRDLETELGVAPSSFTPLETKTHLQPLPAKHEGKVSVSIGQDTVDFGMETHEGGGFAIRLGFDIPTQEKEFLKKRSVVVSQALQKLVGAPTDPKKVPTIAVVASGGGSRAMTGLLGSLRGLQDIGVLDAVSYITGVSGSTWAMADLYQEPNWSQKDIGSVISAKKEQMNQNILNVLPPMTFKYYWDEIAEKVRAGYTASLVDGFGLMVEQLVFGKKVTSTLSEQQKAVNEGQNPLPIYTAVNMKDIPDGYEHREEWCEFTPYEVGIQKYGAFVRTEDFGSQFFLGNVVKKLPEVRLPYLIGIWSSAISVNMSDLWEKGKGFLPSLRDWLKHKEKVFKRIDADGKEFEVIVETLSFTTDVLTTRAFIAKMSNFTHGLSMHRDYIQHSNFVDGDEKHPDAFPNQLTPSDSTLRLIDSGHVINIGCVPVLRPERDVDLIISLSYSWEPEHIFSVLEKTAAHCKDHGIPFPNVDVASLEKEPQKEFYIFEDKENPRAPIVVHFPLVNVTYKHFKHPGVKRETEEDIRAGEVDVSSSSSPYTTRHFTYSKEDYDALVDLTTYNVLNNKESILEALRKALEMKASKIKK